LSALTSTHTGTDTSTKRRGPTAACTKDFRVDHEPRTSWLVRREQPGRQAGRDREELRDHLDLKGPLVLRDLRDRQVLPAGRERPDRVATYIKLR